MATPNRAALINRVLKVSKKHFQPVPPTKDRTLFEHLLFACLLENSPHAAAEQVFKTFREEYFDWNEVRVSTIRELGEVTKPLVDGPEAAERLKQTLHAVFETVYQFDLETLKKQNIGAAVKQLEKLKGSTPFVVAYVTQMALGGHSIPVNRGLLITMEVAGAVSESEAKTGAVPGLERVVSKTKGVEVGSVLHQLGVEIGRNPYGPAARKLLLEIAPDAKDRLPKRKVAVEEPPPPPPPAPAKTKAGSAKGEKASRPRRPHPPPPRRRKAPNRPLRRKRKQSGPPRAGPKRQRRKRSRQVTRSPNANQDRE